MPDEKASRSVLPGKGHFFGTFFSHGPPLVLSLVDILSCWYHRPGVAVGHGSSHIASARLRTLLLPGLSHRLGV